MRKKVFILFCFVFALFILGINPVFALKPGCTIDSNYSVTTGEACNGDPSVNLPDYIPSCSSVSGFTLTKGQACTIQVQTPAIFNFFATDPESDNLSWSVNWGDTQGIIPKICPSFQANNNLSASHAWVKEGTYFVKLGVSDCKGGDTETLFSVVVKPNHTIDPSIPDADVTKPIPEVVYPSVDTTDIAISSLQNWPDKFVWYPTISIPIKFKINGTTIANFKYKQDMEALISADGKQDTQYTDTSFYPSDFMQIRGGEYTKNIGFTFNECGSHKIKIILNPNKKISEINYDNNTVEKNIEIDCTKVPYDFDMTIKKSNIWPITAIQGNFITLGGEFYNLGKEGDSRFDSMTYGHNGHGPACLYRTDSLGKHEVSCLTEYPKLVVMDKPLCGNNHYVMKVDAYDDVLETNENNNEIEGDVFVDCGKKPDLIIEKVGTWATKIKSGESPIMKFVMKNIGNAPADNAVIRMCIDSKYAGGYWPGVLLNPNSQTQQYTFGINNWKPVCEKGQKMTLYVAADNAWCWGNSEIEETVENNNILGHEVTCE